MILKTTIAAIALALSAGASAQTRGVTDKEIVLGLITDMSGPIVNYGKESRNGMTMAVEEINARGGVQGRKLRVVVEDNGYEPKRAVLAAQKLVTQDGVFAIIGHLGTAPNMATLPFLVQSKVFNFMPQSAARDMYEPASPYKIALGPSNFLMSTTIMDYFFKQKPYQRVGALYQDDDYGRESVEGVQAYLKTRNMTLVEKVSYKRGATDFSSQMARLKAANCDLVFNASTMREYIASVQEARKIGFNPVFAGTSANYAHQVPLLGGKAMEGLHAAAFIMLPYADDANPAVRQWAAAYKKRFNEDPGVYSMFSYYAYTTFATIADKAGRNLSAESFNAAMESTKLPQDALGNPGFNVSASNRLSNDRIRIMKVAGDKWIPASDLLPPPKLN
ncbi:ABC transporter substrate-binding protein [Cupriavidus sp. UME77]|uniref:ABC transporter substrate-binding protein n=1 Tax=Cupriavidus sp. UME77 TaxID=1862321 RepID=UPI0016019FED|nr:ABC transporter substrate-binding protein [Cupriavidus sp. UME77]MBB1633186.1 ABC transporter substrate-binding protein [Cupriavidus sp. UME77]